MAEGKPYDCEIFPTRDSGAFRFRVRLPSPEVPFPGPFVEKSTIVAGCKCTAICWPRLATPRMLFALSVCRKVHTRSRGTRDSGRPVLGADAKVSTHMVLLDKTGTPAPSIMGKGNTDSMIFVRRDHVKANCVVDNYFVVLCYVDIDWTPPDSSVEDGPPDLGHDLGMMWDKQELTDVSFDVGGEGFSAHRLVLAARSPVFKAELYGQMAESKMTTITIQDMEASTFRSMLHYLYHGSLPNAGKADASSTVADYQHLLIAADRYGIERLKKNCEDKLSADGITTDSVVSMLELAEDHVCPKLKARCFDFLADADNFKVVATSGEYLRLMQSFPSLLVEARNRFKIPHEKPTIMEPCSHKKTRLYEE